MPRVEMKKKGGGKVRHCSSCGAEIKKGEPYFTWAFRYGGRRFNCKDHRPRQSELTQSKLSAVYAATENAEDNLGDVMNVEGAEQLLNEVAEAVREVAQEYRDAAEAMGGAGGENEERADELDGFADELESAAFSTDDGDEDAEEFDEDEVGKELSQDMFGIDVPDELEPDQREEWAAALQERRDEFEADETEDEEAREERLTALRDEVQEFLNGCPL